MSEDPETDYERAVERSCPCENPSAIHVAVHRARGGCAPQERGQPPCCPVPAQPQAASAESQLNVAMEAAAELGKARAMHAPMNGPHEGYAVILEELDELWEEVRAKKQDKPRMRKEALQVAAMALRFIEDVCDGK